jgi:hypothetical protein
MNRIARSLAVATAASFASLVAMPSAWAIDARTEAGAKGAIKKAADKYLATDYAAAMMLLSKAARACGAKKCSPATKAAVLRDLGTMQFRSGDKTAASKSFADALALQPDLTLNPDYDAPDLRAAWDEAKGTGSAPAESHPEEDFVHTPATEQTTNTPLPVYVESPGTKFVRVVVKYKGAQMKEWETLELKRVGKGWGAVIPCGKVTAGTMRYWVEGLDQGGEASGTAGDPERPFTVPIRDEITSEAPHLPNRPAPQQCEENEEPSERADAGEKEEKAARVAGLEGSGGEYARWWIGVAGAVDLISLSGGNDLCGLTASAAPANTQGYYCTNPDGSDFPSRGKSLQARSLIPGQAGNVAGGIQAGDLRVMIAVDYALSPEMLIGARVGYLYNSYTGTAAVTDHRAFGSNVHVEARGTYVFGHEPLLRTGFAPTVFVALGVSEFDGHTPSFVTIQNGTAPNTVRTVQPVNVWLTNGPWFLAVGGGARYQFSPRAAFNGAVRVNGAFGGQGALFTFGPEISFQYGF